MRIVFAGTPELAVPSLRALHQAGHEISLVITREDAPVGRKRILTQSPVAQVARELGLPLLKTNRFDERTHAAVRESHAVLGVVVAFGALIPADGLSALREGWINLHFSLLPRFRGAAPVPHNILAGEPMGLTIFQLDEGMDTGPILAIKECEVGPHSTAGEVLSDFSHIGAELLVATIRSGLPSQTPQKGESSLAPKFERSDARLTAEDDAANNYRRFRAFTPEPGAFIELPDLTLKIHEARWSQRSVPAGSFMSDGSEVYWGCAHNSLLLLKVQPTGKRPMSAAEWFRGRR